MAKDYNTLKKETDELLLLAHVVRQISRSANYKSLEEIIELINEANVKQKPTQQELELLQLIPFIHCAIYLIDNLSASNALPSPEQMSRAQVHLSKYNARDFKADNASALKIFDSLQERKNPKFFLEANKNINFTALGSFFSACSIHIKDVNVLSRKVKAHIEKITSIDNNASTSNSADHKEEKNFSGEVEPASEKQGFSIPYIIQKSNNPVQFYLNNTQPGEKTKQFSISEREKYQVFLLDGKYVKKVGSGDGLEYKPATTLENTCHSKTSCAMFVVTPQGEEFQATHKHGTFHHPDLLGEGGSVFFAGGRRIDAEGYLTDIFDDSGHYKPTKSDTLRYVEHLYQQGVDLSKCRVHIRDPLATTLAIKRKAYEGNKTAQSIIKALPKAAPANVFDLCGIFRGYKNNNNNLNAELLVNQCMLEHSKLSVDEFSAMVSNPNNKEIVDGINAKIVIFYKSTEADTKIFIKAHANTIDWFGIIMSYKTCNKQAKAVYDYVLLSLNEYIRDKKKSLDKKKQALNKKLSDSNILKLKTEVESLGGELEKELINGKGGKSLDDILDSLSTKKKELSYLLDKIIRPLSGDIQDLEKELKNLDQLDEMVKKPPEEIHAFLSGAKKEVIDKMSAAARGLMFGQDSSDNVKAFLSEYIKPPVANSNFPRTKEQEKFIEENTRYNTNKALSLLHPFSEKSHLPEGLDKVTSVFLERLSFYLDKKNMPNDTKSKLLSVFENNKLTEKRIEVATWLHCEIEKNSSQFLNVYDQINFLKNNVAKALAQNDRNYQLYGRKFDGEGELNRLLIDFYLTLTDLNAENVKTVATAYCYRTDTESVGKLLDNQVQAEQMYLMQNYDSGFFSQPTNAAVKVEEQQVTASVIAPFS